MTSATPSGTAEVPAIMPLSSPEEAVMRAVARVLIALPRALDADLLREQHMTLNEYMVLMNLSEAAGSALRMSELAAVCDLSLSGTTRLVGKLEGAGLIQRQQCDSDGRGAVAVLTDAGLARLREAWPTNLASVRRHVFDHLTGHDLPRLAAAFNDMASSASQPVRRR